MPGFERDEVEAHVWAALLEATGGPGIDVLASRAEGVVAFARVDRLFPGLDWDVVAADVAARTGLDVVCVADADWSSDEGPDEPATYLAFDVPGLDPAYRDPSRDRRAAASPLPGLTPVSCLRGPTAFEADQYGEEDEDRYYDDGHVWCLCTVHGGKVMLHDFRTAEGERGRGHARRALERIRAEFDEVVANGVEDDGVAEGFWRHVGAEGLVDVMVQYAKPDTDFRVALTPGGP